MAEPPPDRDAMLARIVRESDRPRHYATLFAPADARPHLFALYAFAAEVARVPDSVRQPMLGEIRLQWWQDAVERLGEGGGGGAPVLEGLGEAVRAASLPVGPLGDLAHARRADLYADPLPTRTDLEGFLGETESVVFQMASLILGGGVETADAAGHAGVAYGLARSLAGLSHARSRGRSIVPLDVLTAHGLAKGDVFAAEPPAGLAGAVTDLADLADDHLRKAGTALRDSPPGVRPAFLPLAVVGPLLVRVRRAGPRLAHEGVGLSDLSMLARITAGALVPRRR